MPLPEHAPLAQTVRPSLRDQAFTRILEAIADKTLEPGELLQDNELASWLGMSRQPIRHALLRLADHGRVVMPPGEVPRVAVVSRDRVRELTTLRSRFLRFTVASTVGTLTPRSLDTIVGCAADVAAAVEADAPAWTAEASAAFTAAFADAHGNAVIAQQLDRIRISLAGVTDDRAPEFARCVAAIVAAARSGDAAAARDAVDRFDASGAPASPVSSATSTG